MSGAQAASCSAGVRIPMAECGRVVPVPVDPLGGGEHGRRRCPPKGPGCGSARPCTRSLSASARAKPKGIPLRGTCPVFCVSVLQIGVDSVGVGGGELGQGLVPVGGDLSFDELALGPALGCWQSFLLVAFSGSFVLDVTDRQLSAA